MKCDFVFLAFYERTLPFCYCLLNLRRSRNSMRKRHFGTMPQLWPSKAIGRFFQVWKCFWKVIFQYQFFQNLIIGMKCTLTVLQRSHQKGGAQIRYNWMILEDVETSLNLALPWSWDFSCVSVSLLHSLLSNMSLMIDVWDRTIEGRLTSLKRDIVVTRSRMSDTTLMYQPWSSDQKKEIAFGLERGTKKLFLAIKYWF